MIKKMTGGICAPKGFRAGGVHCGIRKNREKRDLALVVADVRCSVACAYTRNLVKGAPILVTQRHVEDGYAQAIIVNSGNANTCNANGVLLAESVCELVARNTGVPAEDVVIASTGVIGQEMTIDPFERGMKALVNALGRDASHASEAAEAIMTTDTVRKEIAFSFDVDGVPCHIGAMAKGVGMICPNMATMLFFVTTDADVSPSMLQRVLKELLPDTVNMLSVDGDTSTNDTLCILSSGLAGNARIEGSGTGYLAFKRALKKVLVTICRMLAKDGEGATKLIECRVHGAKSKKDARLAAKSVVCSDLVKAAMFGRDANWGRVLCALGYSGAKIDVHGVDLVFRSSAGEIEVCKNGYGVPFSEEKAKDVLSSKEVVIDVSLHDGSARATAWGCDLTYDYVKINGDYRT